MQDFRKITRGLVSASAWIDNWTLNYDDAMAYGFMTNPDKGMTGGYLKITPEMAAGGCRPSWVGYVGVPDCDAAVKAVEKRGGKCLRPARDVPMAGRIAMVADPEGAPFYVMKPTPPPDGGESTAFSPTLLGRCASNELPAQDQQGAIDFYTSLFGWELSTAMEMGDFGTYQMLACDGVQIGAVMKTPPGGPLGWAYYFRVRSIDAAVSIVAANGGQVLNGPMEVPGGDWIIQGADPQGAYDSVVGRSEIRSLRNRLRGPP